MSSSRKNRPAEQRDDKDAPSTSSRSRRVPSVHRIVICGSMAFYANMVEQRRLLRELGIKSIIPDPDKGVFHEMAEDDSFTLKRTVSMKHIRRVRDGKTFGILVLNLDKHGIPDYIGPNSFAEIAVALAHYKRIYLYQGIPTFYRDELVAWAAVPLNGDLSRLAHDLKEHIAKDVNRAQQLMFFDS